MKWRKPHPDTRRTPLTEAGRGERDSDHLLAVDGARRVGTVSLYGNATVDSPQAPPAAAPFYDTILRVVTGHPVGDERAKPGCRGAAPGGGPATVAAVAIVATAGSAVAAQLLVVSLRPRCFQGYV